MWSVGRCTLRQPLTPPAVAADLKKWIISPCCDTVGATAKGLFLCLYALDRDDSAGKLSAELKRMIGADEALAGAQHQLLHDSVQAR